MNKEVKAIRAEVERLMSIYDSEYDKEPTEANSVAGNTCHQILAFIDGIEEESFTQRIMRKLTFWK